MARLRVYDQQQVVPGQIGGGTISAPRVQTGEIAAQQLQQAGRVVQQAGQVGASIVADMLEKQNEVRVTEALTVAQQRMLERQRELSQLKGADALTPGPDGIPPVQRLSAQLDRDFGQIGTELKLTPTQQERFNVALAPLTQRFNASAADYELRENEAYQQTVYTTAVKTNQDLMLAAPMDAANVGMATVGIERATRQEADRLGLPPEATELMVLENVGKGHVAAIAALADQNPRDAQTYYERNSTWMTPSQQATARQQFVPAMRADNAERWVEEAVGRVPPAPPGEPGAKWEMPIAGASLPGPGDRDFGPRASFRTANGARASSDHNGVDLPAAAGTSVRAPAGGTVVRAGTNGGYGNYVEIRHGDGTVTFYGHLQDFDVKEGDSVTAGQPFARVGSTGNSTGPHLHMGARAADGSRLNPAELFSETRTAPVASPATVTRAQLYRQIDAEFGDNPTERNAHRAAADQFISRRDADQRAAEGQARDAALTYIEQNRRMPPASMMAALPPGSEVAMTDYLEALNAPPVVRTDPALELALVSNPEAWAHMTPMEFVAKYGRDMSHSDLQAYVGSLARDNSARAQQQRAAAQQATVLPVEAFGRAWTSTMNSTGIRMPDAKDIEGRRQYETLMSGLRDWTIARQQVEGRQLTDDEIRAELGNRMARLSWDRSGWTGGRTTVYATSYATMQQGDRSWAREQLRARGVERPTEDQIYQTFVRSRLSR